MNIRSYSQVLRRDSLSVQVDVSITMTQTIVAVVASKGKLHCSVDFFAA